MENEIQNTEQTQPQAEIKTEAPITETASIIDRADAVAKRMEEANKKAEQLLARQEAVAARMMLSGRSEAGQIKKTAEEEQKEQLDEKVKAALGRYK